MNEQVITRVLSGKVFISHIGYPLIFFIFCSVGIYAICTKWDLGLTTISLLFFTYLYFICLERIIPFKKSWWQTKKQWHRDVICFFLVLVYGAAGASLVRIIAMQLADHSNEYSLLFNSVIAILISSFIGYWLHRFEHNIKIGIIKKHNFPSSYHIVKNIFHPIIWWLSRKSKPQYQGN